jgi:SAM-dependent methyltransferase
MTVVFDAYARYYDLLYRDKDYGAEAQYVASHVRRHDPDAKRVLELGCGTGAHAEHLARQGYVVHGVDLSETMLARAQERKSSLPADAAKRLTFGRGDVRTVRTGETYDAVISLFHVMSYQTTNADLAAAFSTAAAHLKRGGLFLFDFWYGPGVLTQKPEVRVKRLSDHEINVTRIAEPAMRESENVVEVNYAVLIEVKATGKVEQVQETHRMRYLSLPELALLWKDLFEERATLAWMNDTPPSTQSWAAFQILARTAR